MQRWVMAGSTSSVIVLSPSICGVTASIVPMVIVETEKFSYDLFGETVALAFEVERLAPPKGIACSESVLKALVTKPAVRPIGTIRARRSGAFVGVLLVEGDPE